MSTRIAHISDTHDRPSIVRQVAGLDADIILITGDCMNNRGRVNGQGIIPANERKYQQGWFRKQAKKWAVDFAGRPVVCIGGNHDFIGYTRWLTHYGVEVYEITDERPMVEVAGIRFAGFRQVPYLMGEWVGEEHDLRPMVEKALACDPTVLVTHAPPAGILDMDSADDGGYGVRELMAPLFYGEHRITDHFFGHAHKNGGQTVEEGGIRFHNGAGHCIVHEVC